MKNTFLNCSAAATAIAVATSLSATAANAQGEGEIVDDSNVDVVISVGTRRSARSAADSPAPVDVIGGNELLNQGDTDLSNLLRTSVPSYNVNTQPISDAATLIRPANLRGLAPDSTLVLVNGKRRHRAAVISFLGGGVSDGSQGADISVIPSIALKQVEILRDGAASQYGSDAIAGVINFVLRDAPDGITVEGQWGSTYEGDGDQYKIAANIGLPIPIGEGGFFNVSAEYGETDATSRSTQRDDAAALIAAGNTAVANPAQIWGQPNVNDDFTIFANAAIPFSDLVEAYAFGNYSERQVEGGFFFRNPNTRGSVNSNDGGATLLVGDLTTDGSGACPVITVTNNVPDPVALAAVAADPDCFVFNELLPGGFTPRFGGDLEDKSVVAGIRGEIPFGNGLRYDISYTYGRNDVDFFINNTINASLGPNTPRDFMPGGYSQVDNNLNVDFGYSIPVGIFASDLNFALGFEHRSEEFTIRAGDPASFQIGPLAAPSVAFPAGQGFSSSSNGFGGFTTASAGTTEQKNYAVYGEVGADLTDDFTLEGAVRYEDFYDSFGDTLNYKIGALYSVSDNLSVRSTYSTGFHAPTAGQANVTNITTAFSGSTLVDQGTIPLSSNAGQFIADFIVANGGDRPTLGPEKSKNFTLGAALDVGNVKFTVDFFQILVDDRISISEQQDFLGALQQTATNNMVAFSPMDTTSQLLNLLDAASVLNSADFAGSEDLTSFGFFNNDFDTRTRGMDFVLSSSLDIVDGGVTDVNIATNWTDTKVTRRGTLGDGRLRQLEENIPHWRSNMTITHRQGPVRGLFRVNYYGPFFEDHLDSGLALPIDGASQMTFDVELGYQVIDNIEVIAGARNVFDSHPTENPWAGVAGATYAVTAPGGFNGGSYYFKVRAEF